MKFLSPDQAPRGSLLEGLEGVGKIHIELCDLWGVLFKSIGKGQPTKFMGGSFGFSSSSSKVFWLCGFMSCRLFILFLLR